MVIGNISAAGSFSCCLTVLSISYFLLSAEQSSQTNEGGEEDYSNDEHSSCESSKGDDVDDEEDNSEIEMEEVEQRPLEESNVDESGLDEPHLVEEEDGEHKLDERGGKGDEKDELLVCQERCEGTEELLYVSNNDQNSTLRAACLKQNDLSNESRREGIVKIEQAFGGDNGITASNTSTKCAQRSHSTQCIGQSSEGFR